MPQRFRSSDFGPNRSKRERAANRPPKGSAPRSGKPRNPRGGGRA